MKCLRCHFSDGGGASLSYLFYEMSQESILIVDRQYLSGQFGYGIVLPVTGFAFRGSLNILDAI